MDIQEKLDSIQQRKQDLINSTPEEQKNKVIKSTFDEYVSAKEINEYAPEQLQQAELNYYKAKYGVDYKDKLKEKYKVDTIQISDKKTKAHKNQMKQLNDTLNNYKNSEEYSKRINEIKAMYLAKIKSLIQKIRLSEAHTNQQKTFYTEQEEDTIHSYIISLNWFIGLFTVYFVINNRSNINSKTVGQSIFLLSIIFLIRPLLHLKSSSIQFNIGYDPMKSKITWVIYTFFILLLIWLWVYLDVFTMLYQTVPVTPVIPIAPTTVTPIAPTTPPMIVGIGAYLHLFANNIYLFMVRVYQNMMQMYNRLFPVNAINAIRPARVARPRVPRTGAVGANVATGVTGAVGANVATGVTGAVGANVATGVTGTP